MASLGRWCFRHRWMVLAVWVVALIGFTVAGRAAGTDFSTAFQLPNTPSTQATDLLQKNFPAVSGDSDQIVLHARSGTVRDPAITAAATKMLAQVATLPHVRAVTSPYGPAGPARSPGTAPSRSPRSILTSWATSCRRHP